jgi:hypothetical protein
VRALLLFALVAMALLSAAEAPRKFTGKISDSECARADHRQMQMGADDAECTIACVHAHGALYVLYDGKQAYTLSDQQQPEKFAGKQVTVMGALDAKGGTILVASMVASK